MPIYEYRCAACDKKTAIFVRTMSTSFTPACEHCGSTNVQRLVSSFGYAKSTQRVWEQSGEPTMSPSDDYYKDPRNIGRWTEKRLKELGVEMPEQAKEMIDAARQGELPPPVKDL